MMLGPSDPLDFVTGRLDDFFGKKYTLRPSGFRLMLRGVDKFPASASFPTQPGAEALLVPVLLFELADKEMLSSLPNRV